MIPSENIVERFLGRRRAKHYLLPVASTFALWMIVAVSSPSHPYIAIPLIVILLPLLHLIVAAPTLGLPLRLRRQRRVSDLLLAPLTSWDFFRVFQKAFWKAEAWCVLTAFGCLMISELVSGGNSRGFGPDLPEALLMFTIYTMVMTWTLYWSLVYSPAWGWLIPLCLFLAIHGLASIDGAVAVILGAVLWLTAGIVLCVDCYTNYLDHLRRKFDT